MHMLLPRLLNYDMGPGVTAFSTTRHGGCSSGHYASFNINRYCGDSEEAICRNRLALCSLLGIDDNRLIMPHQTHGTKVVHVDKSFGELSHTERREQLEGVDALTTCLCGLCIGVSTADCIPVLLFDKEHLAVGAVHAGWRGTMQRIVEKTVKQMMELYDSRPLEITAQIGPGISIDNFEVGEEVYDAFISGGFDMSPISRRYPNSADNKTQKWHIDLPECNRQQLLACGILPQHIHSAGICTFKQHADFFSARRLGIHSGRIFTGIMLQPNHPV